MRTANKCGKQATGKSTHAKTNKQRISAGIKKPRKDLHWSASPNCPSLVSNYRILQRPYKVDGPYGTTRKVDRVGADYLAGLCGH